MLLLKLSGRWIWLCLPLPVVPFYFQFANLNLHYCKLVPPSSSTCTQKKQRRIDNPNFPNLSLCCCLCESGVRFCPSSLYSSSSFPLILPFASAVTDCLSDCLPGLHPPSSFDVPVISISNCTVNWCTFHHCSSTSSTLSHYSHRLLLSISPIKSHLIWSSTFRSTVVSLH